MSLEEALYKDFFKSDEIKHHDNDLVTANDYQQSALRTANTALPKGDLLLEGVMGMSSEAGEALNLVRKKIFQGHPLDREHLALELGDVSWYLCLAANSLGFDLQTIFEKNIRKLSERYPDGFSSERSINRKEG